MGDQTGKEYANLYMRGVNEGYNGEELDAQELLDLLDVFGEDGLLVYLVGILEGEEDAEEDEADALAELESEDEGEEALDDDADEEPNPN